MNPQSGSRDSGVSGRGVVAKTRTHYRMSFKQDGALVAQGGHSSFLPYEVATGKRVKSVYRPVVSLPNGDRVGGKIRFTEIPDNGNSQFPAVSGMVPMPIFALAGENGEPLLAKKPRPGLGETLSWSVEKRSNARVSVTIDHVGTANEKWTNRSRYTIWTKPRFPVVEEIEHTFRGGAGGKMTEKTITVGWTDCGGGVLMPSRLVVVLELDRERIKPSPKHNLFRARIWEADDLGARQPNERDFEVTVAPQTRLVGLQATFADQRTFDLTKISVDDLANLEHGSVPPHIDLGIPTSQAPSQRFVPSFRLVFGSITVVGAILLAVANRIRHYRITSA